MGSPGQDAVLAVRQQQVLIHALTPQLLRQLQALGHVIEVQGKQCYIPFSVFGAV